MLRNIKALVKIAGYEYFISGMTQIIEMLSALFL